jgi:hypothetical protein
MKRRTLTEYKINVPRYEPTASGGMTPKQCYVVVLGGGEEEKGRGARGRGGLLKIKN